MGMHIKYTNKRTAEITMTGYLKEAIEESGMGISKASPTPAMKRLLDVDEESSPLLSRAEGEVFHSVYQGPHGPTTWQRFSSAHEYRSVLWMTTGS